MSWKIEVRSKKFEYYLNDETYYSSIELEDEVFDKEKSAGYQEPDDDVLKSTFIAKTEHGNFKWLIRSARTGFNSYAEIEDSSVVEQPKM